MELLQIKEHEISGKWEWNSFISQALHSAFIAREVEGILHSVLSFVYKNPARPHLLSFPDHSLLLPRLGWCRCLVGSRSAPESAQGLKDGLACTWGTSGPLGWWQEHLGPKGPLVNLHFQVECEVSASHCVSSFNFFLASSSGCPKQPDAGLMSGCFYGFPDALWSCFLRIGFIPPYAKWRACYFSDLSVRQWSSLKSVCKLTDWY